MGKEKKTIYIYSCYWPQLIALKYLCEKKHSKQFRIRVESFRDKKFKGKLPPDIIVLDMAPRDNIGFIVELRKRFNTAIFVFVQDYFLFADEIVGDYFGGVFLKEYNSILVGYSEITLIDHLYDVSFSGVSHPIRSLKDSEDVESIIDLLNESIELRLQKILPSSTAGDMVMKWLRKKNDWRNCQRAGCK